MSDEEQTNPTEDPAQDDEQLTDLTVPEDADEVEGAEGDTELDEFIDENDPVDDHADDESTPDDEDASG